MAYGNNRLGDQPRAHFQLAGGINIKFRHPFLAGQISKSEGTLDEIDISACCKLEGRYFEANPDQDSAKQVVLIDGSTVTICNKLLNGTITIPAVRTTGFVATGDFIAACQLIKSVGDTVGGLLTKTDTINGKAISRLYYGVTVQRCPDDVSEGMDVGVYNIQLKYAGWIETVNSADTEKAKKIWATGGTQGLVAYYAPYQVQNNSGETGTKENPSTSSVYGAIDDTTVNNFNYNTSGAEKTVGYNPKVTNASLAGLVKASGSFGSETYKVVSVSSVETPNPEVLATQDATTGNTDTTPST